MKQSYDDLLQLTKEKPKWWDESGVPRFCAPYPADVNCIYAREVLFYTVACQACGEKFLVASSWSYYGDSLSKCIEDHRIHYGDPPNAGCCTSGPTMNSEPLEIHSFWRRDGGGGDWVELKEYKGRKLE